MLRRAALLALFTLTPLGAAARDVELAAVRAARKKRKKKPATTASAGAKGAKRRKRRRRRRAARREQAAVLRGPWLAFGLSALATAAAGVILLIRRRRPAAKIAGPEGDASRHRLPKLTDPYDRT